MSIIKSNKARPKIAVFGSKDWVEINRVFCVGRNYATHALEMNSDPDKEPPFFFTKGPEAVVANNQTIAYPPRTRNYQYEVELVVVISKPCFEISVSNATAVILGYCVGLDMTRRDLQLSARKKGQPWDMAKNVMQSAPMSEISKIDIVGEINSGQIQLCVNGKVRQHANIKELIWSVPQVISILSSYCPLTVGDVIFTGTPAGVGAVNVGDKLIASIDKLQPLNITIGEKYK